MRQSMKLFVSIMLLITLSIILVACGPKETVYTLSMDTQDVFENNDLFNPTLLDAYDNSNGLAELTYTLTVTIDGQDQYIMEKVLQSSGENDDLNINVHYTYTGTYTMSDNELALEAPDFASIDNDWGVIANFVNFHNGKATSDDFEDLLKGAASLYLTAYGDYGITLSVNDSLEIVSLVNIFNDDFIETEHIVANPVDGYDPIYGKLVLPREFSGKIPMVSIAHGMNRSYKDKVYNARAYAAAGIGAYVFNYDSGTAPYAVCLQEVEAAFESVLSLDFTDTNNVFLSGYSYGGGLSSRLAAMRATEENDVKGILLVYPAISSSNNYELITPFTGPVIIFQGDEDEVINMNVILGAAAAYHDAELVVIEGGKHGKEMKFEEIVYPSMIDFINDNLSS